ncbi:MULTISPECIES: Gfo/Idh/MocA family oxidoreductase [unclassified Microbacterium]|uniref:Gfo/Idh/MocA family protein n=1 Tax=unclassified Microbacterium TaxID=2609290 RepID=UPI00214CCC65|nr:MULTISPECIES: Gfo/Idh/MocA family oxidoreductase [unclassified Microbacterium]MCR2808547.1 Gfo/Idh/MocA family oxidoreductase [Microbacterium sp. zg.B185]WIM19014.1 Gfo/Idh/MocA family oxidoreductase [Microbacterium sp. zg-B185]
MSHGVGIVGAGPGAAALHLPTIARMPEDFSVVHISDAGSGRAEQLASPIGARWSAGTAELLADPRVSVVVLCSPPAEHAVQILASVAAGKPAVLCEKPLATTPDDAATVIAACREAGTALLIGTNHLYDPAWGRAKHHLLAGGRPVRAVSVTLALPPNGRYHDVVTNASAPASVPARGAPDLSEAGVAASVVRALITGLAVHDLPILRDLAPVFERVVFARAIAPIGYAVGYRASGIPVRLTTVMLPSGADAVWRLDITTDTDLVEVSFPPAFVHAGSATVRVTAPSGRVTTYPPAGPDGYVAEWGALADLLNGTSVVEYDELLDDSRYALTLAEAAAARIRSGGGP